MRVREVASRREYLETYDALVLSTGATPVVPPVPGTDLPQVRTLRSVPDADRVQELLTGARSAVVVGAGFIGLESAEALRHRGLAVTVVELAAQVLPVLDPEMAGAVEAALVRGGVAVRTGTSVTGIRPAVDGVLVELSDATVLAADLVLLAVGVRPETGLAAGAGLAQDPRGCIVVDEHLRTSAAGVYAVGDAIQVVDAVLGEPASVPLAGPANRQGRAVADHLFGRTGSTGRTTRSSRVLGTAIVRVFDTVAATTGRSEGALRGAGVDVHAVHLHPGDHAGYYPGAEAMHLKVVFGTDGRVLGAQATGGRGVDKRVDVLATAIRAGLHVDDLAELELAYSPPFGSAKDPVNMAGFLAQNVLAGDVVLWHAADLSWLPDDAVLLDVRSREEHEEGHLAGSLNIPHTELRARLGELPRDVPVWAYCASGFRSYLASRVLRQRGWRDVRTLSGGLQTLELAAPGLVCAPCAQVAPQV